MLQEINLRLLVFTEEEATKRWSVGTKSAKRLAPGENLQHVHHVEQYVCLSIDNSNIVSQGRVDKWLAPWKKLPWWQTWKGGPSSPLSAKWAFGTSITTVPKASIPGSLYGDQRPQDEVLPLDGDQHPLVPFVFTLTLNMHQVNWFNFFFKKGPPWGIKWEIRLL